MKKVTSVFLCCFLFIALNYAQSGQVMTLKECIEMGIANNLSLQNKNLNVQKSKYGISENRFKLLPVINAFANFTNSPEPAVSVTDGSKYGTPYNTSPRHYDTMPMAVYNCNYHYIIRPYIQVSPSRN